MNEIVNKLLLAESKYKFLKKHEYKNLKKQEIQDIFVKTN